MESKTQRKVLQIITKSNFGGAQKYVYELSTSLKERGFDVVVAFGGNGILKNKLEEDKIRTISIKSLDRNINIFSDIKTFFELIKLIKKEKPEIIHLNSSKIGGIGALVARLCMVPRIIFTVHGLAFNENRNFISKIIIKKIYFLTILLSHKSIAVSENVKKQLLEIPFSFIIKNKIKAVRNEILPVNFYDRNFSRDLIFNKIREINNNFENINKAQSDESFKIIGSIAELHHVKGLNFLISSAKDILKQNPNTIFAIFGEGEERENLQKQISDLNLDKNFFLLGFVDNAPRYLKGFDLFVLPSVSEALALVILEAKQADIKIVASDIGGIPEAIYDYNDAKLFESKNSEDLTSKIIEVLNKQKHSENIINFKENFDIMINNTIDLYN